MAASGAVAAAATNDDDDDYNNNNNDYDDHRQYKWSGPMAPWPQVCPLPCGKQRKSKLVAQKLKNGSR